MNVVFRPAAEGTGLVFIRSDLTPMVRIPAVVGQRIEIPRRTTLVAGGAQVEMVEHLLAALYALQIDNCELYVDAPEMPGGDGSCQAIVAALDAAGIVEQAASRPRLIVTDVLRVGDDECWVEARPARNEKFSVRYRLDYGSNGPIHRQTLELAVTPASFRKELAPARTFLLQEEAEWLRERGLGTRVKPQDILVFGPDGPVENSLRFEDECVRHKALDLVGDLALAGCDLVGQFLAHRSGHRLNADLVRALLQEVRPETAYRRTG